MKTVLSIEGMSCEHCVKAVESALKAVSGVKKAKVSLKKKNAEVNHEDSVALDSLKTAVSEAGFQTV
ncbi:MAG: cation transporter [Spirochaetaceae bacterium]|jgi:copper ion binding protein|nr:cation transporter [Spirochaetaceae bacterium]GMO29590.1 MAG: copper ion binding protein [Termitinemataceae bacterium]